MNKNRPKMIRSLREALDDYSVPIDTENFAEAKAIARLSDIDNPDRWVEEDRGPIDVESLDKAIVEAG
jgi:hypothetical protein